MTSARGTAEFTSLIAAQDRRLEREGIPMYLVLVSEVAEVPAPPAACVASGRQVAGALDRFRTAMAPTQRDDDHGVYISVMQAVSHCEFDASRLAGVTGAGAGDTGAVTSDTGADPDSASDTDTDPIRPHGPRDTEAAL